MSDPHLSQYYRSTKCVLYGCVKRWSSLFYRREDCNVSTGAVANSSQVSLGRLSTFHWVLLKQKLLAVTRTFFVNSWVKPALQLLYYILYYIPLRCIVLSYSKTFSVHAVDLSVGLHRTGFFPYIAAMGAPNPNLPKGSKRAGAGLV